MSSTRKITSKTKSNSSGKTVKSKAINESSNCDSEELKHLIKSIKNTKFDNFLGIFGAKKKDTISLIQGMSYANLNCVINKSGDTPLILAMKKYKTINLESLKKKMEKNIIMPLLLKKDSYIQLSEHLSSRPKSIGHIKESLSVIFAGALQSESNKENIVKAINDILYYNDAKVIFYMIYTDYKNDKKECYSLLKDLKKKYKDIINIDELMSTRIDDTRIFDLVFDYQCEDNHSDECFNYFIQLFNIHKLLGEEDKTYEELKKSYNNKLLYPNFGGKSNLQNKILQVFVQALRDGDWDSFNNGIYDFLRKIIMKNKPSALDF